MSEAQTTEEYNGDKGHEDSTKQANNTISDPLSSKKEDDATVSPPSTTATTTDATTDTTTTTNTDTATSAITTAPSSKSQRGPVDPNTKSQQKKRIRREKLKAINKRRKQQDKDAKIAKAKADGRDLDAERKLVEERTKSGEGRRKREAKWQERMKDTDTSFKVCIDCSFEEQAQMTVKEIGSLASQIRYCYAANKNSDNPIHLSTSSLSGATYESLKRVSGFPDQWRAFSCSDKPLLDVHPDKSNVVYLSSDSDYTLEHLDDTKTYVIGGIVDRNRCKGLTTVIAKEMGITTAKLPIDQYLHLCATKVLTCNHVFEILLKYRERNNNWKEALLDVLPARKDITEVSK